MSDVPLGAMLSGGLDSSLIVALMARNMDEPVKTFSVGFTEAGAGNELADAREVATLLGTEHHELELSMSDHAVDLAELVWFLDEPLADLSSLGFLALSELAAEHVTVALSGQGADELLGGYLKHRAAAVCGYWNRLPRPLRSAGRAALPFAPSRFERAGRTITAPDAATRLVAMSSKLDESLRRQLVRGPLADLDGSSPERAVRGLLRDFPDDPAHDNALPRRTARARGRHAALLRPCLDGAFARGSGAIPRPPDGRILRDDSRPAQGGS